MRLHDPQWLLLLLLLLPWLWLQRGRRQRQPVLAMPEGAQLAALPDTLRARCGRYLPYLRPLLLALLILALARPQLVERETSVHSEGVDLIVAIDLSTSMLAEGLHSRQPARDEARQNRLSMAKAVLADFVRSRPGDRIGLLAFAARPYPAAPLTLDHEWLLEAVAGLQTGLIEDGTAIGDAILSALNRLRGLSAQDRSPGKARSQAIILITDGRSNAGTTSPLTAAAAAKALGVRVHTIGIGTRGPAVIPIEDPLGGTLYRPLQADLDETVLRQIAATTGGSYARADDRDSLQQVVGQIDRLEKRRIEEKVFFSYRELFPALLMAVLALGLLELLLRATLLRRLP